MAKNDKKKIHLNQYNPFNLTKNRISPPMSIL